LDLICTDCGSKRTIATSDAFHCDGRCVTCAKAARRANKQRAG
jgi:hypothetical protein